jgi:hypothetical protein
MRRKRQHESLQHTAQQILALRPASIESYSATAQQARGLLPQYRGESDKQEDAVDSFTLHQRVGNLETVVASSIDLHGAHLFSGRGCADHVTEWGPFQSAVPASTLESECSAVKRIQRAWRQHCNGETVLLWQPLAYLCAGCCYTLPMVCSSLQSLHICCDCRNAGILWRREEQAIDEPRVLPITQWPIEVVFLPRVLTFISGPRGSHDLQQFCASCHGVKNTVQDAFERLIRASTQARAHMAFVDIRDISSVRAVSFRHSLL